jgi:hypothetical protein
MNAAPAGVSPPTFLASSASPLTYSLVPPNTGVAASARKVPLIPCSVLKSVTNASQVQPLYTHQYTNPPETTVNHEQPHT